MAYIRIVVEKQDSEVGRPRSEVHRLDEALFLPLVDRGLMIQQAPCVKSEHDARQPVARAEFPERIDRRLDPLNIPCRPSRRRQEQGRLVTSDLDVALEIAFEA